MLSTVQSIIDVARVLANDDHVDNEQWIAPANWLTFFNWEWQDLYKRLVRSSLVTPAATDTAFTGHSVDIPTGSDPASSGVLAVVGVAENLTSSYRMLRPAQSEMGHYPFWVGTNGAGKSAVWAAYGAGDDLSLELYPRDSSGSYVVRWIPTPIYVANPGNTVDLPMGCERRVALGMVSHALIKDSSALAALERKIQRADEEIGLSAFGKIAGDGPKVRRVRSKNQRTQVTGFGTSGWMMDPGGWFFV